MPEYRQPANTERLATSDKKFTRVRRLRLVCQHSMLMTSGPVQFSDGDIILHNYKI